MAPDQAVNGLPQPVQRWGPVSTSPELAARLVGYSDSISGRANLMAATQAVLTGRGDRQRPEDNFGFTLAADQHFRAPAQRLNGDIS